MMVGGGGTEPGGLRSPLPSECGSENETNAISKHGLLRVREKSTVGCSGLARVLEESELNKESGR